MKGEYLKRNRNVVMENNHQRDIMKRAKIQKRIEGEAIERQITKGNNM